MPKRNIIVIGTSAGGVGALCELTRNLPQDLEATLFVVLAKIDVHQVATRGSRSDLAGALR